MELNNFSQRDTDLVMSNLNSRQEKIMGIKHLMPFLINIFIKKNLHLLVESALKNNFRFQIFLMFVLLSE